MQAVILAAGRGERLRPLTDKVPKPMLKLAGKPILEYTLSILPREIDEVILVIGYRGEQIKNYFGDSVGSKKIFYTEQPELKGTGDALLQAKPFLKDNYFLLLYADDLYHPEDLKNCLQDTPTVLVKETDHPERFGVCLVGEGNRLIDILEKQPNPPSCLVNIGVYFLNQEIFTVPPIYLPNGEINLAGQIGVWAKKRMVKIIKAKFWQPIGYPEDLERAEYFLRLPLSKRVN